MALPSTVSQQTDNVYRDAISCHIKMTEVLDIRYQSLTQCNIIFGTETVKPHSQQD